MHVLPWMALQGGGSSGEEPARAMQVRMAHVLLAAAQPATASPVFIPAPGSPPLPEPKISSPVSATATATATEAAPLAEQQPAPSSALETELAGPAPGEPGWVFDPESYIEAEEVDTPPQLVGEWVVNEAAVPPKGADRPPGLRVVVRMWVSDQGRIDIVQYLDADPLVPWLEAFLQDIGKTRLMPAIKDGVAVGASWMVELNLDLSEGL
jgi:hypothetical protein